MLQSSTSRGLGPGLRLGITVGFVLLVGLDILKVFSNPYDSLNPVIPCGTSGTSQDFQLLLPKFLTLYT